MLQSTITRVYRHGHLFAGIGAGAKGFNQARPRVGNMVGRWECAGGIDVDPGAIRNFERLTGVPGTVMDLFSRDQYRAFHGREPDWDWREAVPADIRAALGALTCMLLSPPCKGFSGLLSQAKSLTDKYQALNALTLRGIWLTLEAYKDDPIRIILIENVPRIQTRGRWLLDQIIALLRAYGYSVNEDRHDCGELGHLAQSRKRFILIARHAERVPPFIYQPRKYPLRGVGEVIGQMPLPGDPLAGPMHRVPSLQWQTWVRLAFVEAGSDWRSLNKLAVENGVLRDYGIRPETPLRDNAYGVCRWEDRSPLVTSARAPGQGRFSVADPRAFCSREGSGYLGVRNWIDHVGVVSSRGGPTNGSFSVADPRPGYREGTHTNLLSVAPYDAAARVVSGAAHVAGGALSVADPCIRAQGRQDDTAAASSLTFTVADPTPGYGPATHRHVLGVVSWAATTGVVTGSPKPTTGAHSVADPRVDGHLASVQLGVRNWDRPAGVVTANMWVGSGPNAVSDPRAHRSPTAQTFRIVAITEQAGAVADPRAREGRHTNGKYRVCPYDSPTNAVIGASTTGMGAFVVADPIYREGEIGQYANKMRVVPATAAAPTVTGSDRVGSGALSVADPRPKGLTRGDRQNYLSQSHYGIVGWTQHTKAIPGHAKDNNGSWSIAEPREADMPAEAYPTGLPAKDDRLVARIVALDGTWHRPFTSAELLVIQGILDPRRYAVDLVDHETVRAFICDHHYLPRYPAAQVAVGLFGPGPAGRSILSGLIVFGVPATGAVITRHTGFEDPAQGCVLQRLLCLPSVAANGESFFAARAFRLLRLARPRIEAVVSFSDPAYGHCGGVYAALSGAYRGRTRPRQVLRIAGETIPDRTLSKIRNLESGHAGAIDQLVRLGAPRPRPMEQPREWLDRLRETNVLTTARQSPLFTYCFELTRAARRTAAALPRLAYPVRSDVLREQLGA